MTTPSPTLEDTLQPYIDALFTASVEEDVCASSAAELHAEVINALEQVEGYAPRDAIRVLLELSNEDQLMVLKESGSGMTRFPAVLLRRALRYADTHGL